MTLSFPKFVLFGDSITEYTDEQNGFALASALQNLYRRKLDVVTRGFSGYNTDLGLVALRECLEADNAKAGAIKLMYIFMGTNDAAHTFQAVPVDRYRSNLQAMVKLVKRYNIKIVLVGPGLHDQKLVSKSRAEKDEADEVPFSSNKATRMFADVARDVARDESLPFIDLWDEFQKHGGWSKDELLQNEVDLSELLVDGIHYTPVAYKLFYSALVKTINRDLPDLAAENLSMTLPSYRDVDYEDIEGSIMRHIERF